MRGKAKQSKQGPSGTGKSANDPESSVVVGRVPSRGVSVPPPERRLRRLHRVWPDREGNISYLLTLCVEGRLEVLHNEAIFERLVEFLLDSPVRYGWFARRFVVMPDHIHLIAHMGHESIRLGQWIKALKAIVGGSKQRGTVAGSGDSAYSPQTSAVPGRVPASTRILRSWRWQEGFHDHKFRNAQSEARKWEYICLNPVRSGFVKSPEEWKYGGEIYYSEAGRAELIRGTPALLETGKLIQDE